ncbi:MAG: alpha/beta hydrolase [Actinobacteria bacterium]|nr:MAG: alpha/beta hydrolase [Actinomycetota bacterium]
MPQTLDLTAGPIEYEDTGGSGPVVLFVHGLLVDGSLWRKVVPGLDGFRCVVPTLPLGSHREPMRDRRALTPVGVADLIAEFMERLELTDVTIVANDTGGAITRATRSRTSCRRRSSRCSGWRRRACSEPRCRACASSRCGPRRSRTGC